jgi:hypothetical protein
MSLALKKESISLINESISLIKMDGKLTKNSLPAPIYVNFSIKQYR